MRLVRKRPSVYMYTLRSVDVRNYVYLVNVREKEEKKKENISSSKVR